MTPNEIKEKMRNEPEFTVGALIALYQHQTPEEQSFQTTAFDNNMGFNKVDSKMLTDLSKFYLQKGYLSDKQIAIARQKLMKYAKQLCGINIEPLKIKGKSNNKPPKPKEKLAKKDSDERIRVEFPYDKDIIFAIKDVNGYWFDANSKTWTMPLTITNIDKLLNLGFKLTSELQQWYDQIYSATSDISVPGLDDILRPFQKEAVSYIESRNGRALVADEMGLGKTIEAIAWIQYRGEEVLPALIVCPANLKLNWVKEINKFTDLGKHVEVLEGMTPYDPKKNIMIINYDILQYWETKLKKIKPKTVIADEIHKAKNRKAKRTKSLTNAARSAKFMIGLTGTPILNQPQEIFQPLKVIKPNLFPNFMNFARRYCNPKHNGFAWDYSGASNTIELNQILTKECFPYYTPICLEKHGTKQIGEVVENGIKDRVLAYDFENAEVQWRQIEAHSKSEGKDRLIRIKHEFGEFTCTPDHPIWTEEKGYIRAAEVTPDLSLLVVQEGEDSSSE